MTVNGGDRVGRGEGESGVDLGGKKEAQGPRGERGRVGERPEEAGGASVLILPRRRRGGVRRGPALIRPRSGNREGEGEWERWARTAGPGVGPVGPGVQWGVFSFSFFLFLCLFCFLLYFLFMFYFI